MLMSKCEAEVREKIVVRLNAMLHGKGRVSDVIVAAIVLRSHSVFESLSGSRC